MPLACPLRPQLRLVAHGHKIAVGGEASPLLVLVELRRAGDEWTRQDVALGPEKDSLGWSWRDFRVTLVDHLYGEWMDLRVECLALELVRSR